MSYVYAVVFDNGVIKFGRSDNLAPRLSSHISDGLVHGSVCVSALVCRVRDSVEAERNILLKASSELDKVDHRREYFTGNVDDASDVMALCDCLPIHTQPVKVGNSLQFVVARTADVASRYVYSSKSVLSDAELAGDRILRLLSSDGVKEVTEGVIFNRVRGLPRSVIANKLIELVESGKIKCREDTHARNGQPIKYYFIKKTC